MSTESRILEILRESKEIRLHDLVEMTGSSRQMVHRAVKSLLEKELVQKIGAAPRTFYKISMPVADQKHRLNVSDQQFLAEHFLLVTETGSRLIGVEAFMHWCNKQKLPFEKTVSEFINTRKKYLVYFDKRGLINGNEKIRATRGFEQIGLNTVYYLDFYAIERFGKTRLGTLLHLAKQGQNRKLMNEIIELSQARINTLVTTQKIDAVGYIPPTIKREVQFMKVLEQKLNLPLSHISLVKVKGEIAVPQKALNKIEDRISNARFSIMITEKRRFRRVLLIDDAVGSGATLNETAIKLKDSRIAEEVIGLAITGSYKGFDVIQEV